jgi:HSP20 family protein
MPGLIIWKNREIDKMKRDIDRLMSRLRNDFSLPLLSGAGRMIAVVGMSETEESIIVTAEVPVVKPDDLHISIVDNVLTIRGETREETVNDGENYRTKERRHGSFSRSLQLPCRIEINDVEATYQEGMLRIVMPKCKPETSREVKIKIK